MTRVFIVCSVLLIAAPAWATQYCVDTTVRQESALTWMVEQANIDLVNKNAGSQTPQPLHTNGTYLKEQMRDRLKDYVQQQKAVTDEQLRRAAETATDDVKVKIQSLLTCGKVTCP